MQLVVPAQAGMTARSLAGAALGSPFFVEKQHRGADPIHPFIARKR
jgi:hypothetical protein